MTEVLLIHTSGGLISEALLADLREPAVGGDAAFLAEVSSFVSRDGNAPTRAELEADLDAGFRSGQALWASYADELARGMEVGRLRERLLRPLFELLGFDLQFQRAHLAAGDHTWAISHLGWDGSDAPPVHLVGDVDLDARSGKKRSPHEEVQGFLNAADAQWGIVTNGHVLRVLRDFHHTTTRGYVEFELAHLFEAASYGDFLALYRVCHASRFSSADEDSVPLETLYERSLSAGVTAGKRLQPQVRRAIEALANGVLETSPELRSKLASEATFGRELYRELLTTLYRMLFLFFAEQRGMLSGAGELYSGTYSMAELRRRCDEGGTEPRRGDLWEGLKVTFSLFGDEARATLVGVYPYNGQLFDQARTPHLSAAGCSNARVVEAVRSLTTMQVGKVTLYVDYRNLGVEELGVVYESLLDYTLLTVAQTTTSGERLVRAGEVYLAPLSVERSDLASYYTPTRLVDLVLDQGLNPLITERLHAAGDDRDAQEAALLDLRVIDPACGSGAFLVGALDRIARAVARARSAPLEPRDSDVAHARRDVLQHCIYGTDKDPFAVELCKVALWIHCIVPDQPLSFLDAHIVCGDSLVGWPMFDLPATIPNEAYEFSKATRADKKILNAARAANRAETDEGSLFSVSAVTPDVTLPAELEGDEASFADVRRKSAVYTKWRAAEGYRAWQAAADLWTSAFFWTADFGPAPTTATYRDAVVGDVPADVVHAAGPIIDELNPLHWPLVFPDIRARGGFDLVISNPPWEQFESRDVDFFAEHAPRIAAEPTAVRKKLIEELDEDNPSLARRWRAYEAIQDRMSHWSKSCGRFQRLSGKVNTYVLFAEMAARLTGRRGVTALVLKTGICVDLSPSPVWEGLVKAGRVRRVIDMVNSAPGGGLVFPSVAAIERFCVLVLGPERDDTSFDAAMMNFGLLDAATAPGRRWDHETLRRTMPRSGTLLSTASNAEIDLALAVHSRWPILDFDSTVPDGENVWGLRYTTLFNSSTDQYLFERREALEANGWTINGDRSLRGPEEEVALPVLEGQMVNRWDHRARTYEGYAGDKKYGKKPDIPRVTDGQHSDESFEVEPRYWMQERTVDDRLNQTIPGLSPIGVRAIGAVWTNRRSMRATLLPRVAATHSKQVFGIAPERALHCLALLNSSTFDFLMRVRMPGGFMSAWVISQCAAPPPDCIPNEVTEIARKLSLTSKKLADTYGMKVHRWDSAERPGLEARCDALVAQAYGLTTAQYETVLDHFTLLARKETEDLGEYRTKRLCLEAFEDIGGRS